jgi:hypothetical protein
VLPVHDHLAGRGDHERGHHGRRLFSEQHPGGQLGGRRVRGRGFGGLGCMRRSGTRRVKAG